MRVENEIIIGISLLFTATLAVAMIISELGEIVSELKKLNASRSKETE